MPKVGSAAADITVHEIRVRAFQIGRRANLGAAARAGIQPGDVILSVNDTPVKSVQQLQALLSKAGKRIAILVQREDAKVYVPVELG